MVIVVCGSRTAVRLSQARPPEPAAAGVTGTTVTERTAIAARKARRRVIAAPSTW
ncbi:hypothetical protein [Nonomuraea composti]|uniref:hypothetical protein n=1 Tax=Nonomuraea composti TaxID=2720023 RepID=UPI001F0EB591|nr:hypothetical protein [Nonomuraea sp. FMUSA5-5]